MRFGLATWLLAFVALFVGWIFPALGQAPDEAAAKVAFGQGVVTGSVGETSAILQTRVTRGTELVEGGLPGALGVVRFEYTTDPSFANYQSTPWQKTSPDQDHIVKWQIDGLQHATRYHWRARCAADHPERGGPPYANWTPDPDEALLISETATFKTLGGADTVAPARLVVTTGWCYHFYMHGYYGNVPPYDGPDKMLGYPSLVSILKAEPDYFFGTGDNVYYDHPGNNASVDKPLGGWTGPAKTPEDIRRKYHEQFVLPRWHDLFLKVPTYWEVDDHDYRFDDSDPYMFAARYTRGDGLPSHTTGVRMFKEQLPVTDPFDPDDKTYRTLRINRDLQVWIIEGRFYRSPNIMPDGPEKSLWGKKQREWLMRTLLESDATFKVIVHPTPLVGPSITNKTDNHTKGFTHEREMFFQWLVDNEMIDSVFFAAGDSHWQYHAKHHPTGLNEFTSGSAVQANSVAGSHLAPGRPDATGEPGEITHLHSQSRAEAGFLVVETTPGDGDKSAEIQFIFRNRAGEETYRAAFNAKPPRR